MKTLFTALALLLLGVLFTGTYQTMEDGYAQTRFFIKKSPTLRIRFENIFAYEADDKSLVELNHDQRQQVMDYCRYRLGIVTQLQSQEQLERCKAR